MQNAKCGMQNWEQYTEVCIVILIRCATHRAQDDTLNLKKSRVNTLPYCDVADLGQQIPEE